STRRTAARGVYQHLLNTWSGEQWNDPGAQPEERIAKAITPELLDNVLAQCRRSFCIGQLQACSIELEEDPLVGLAIETQAWALSGPGRLEQKNAAAGGYAELHYDFRAANRLVLSQTFNTRFAISRLKRLQLYFRPDDSWHALRLTVEKLGRRYVT